jgi:hypothetical protein
VSRAGAEIPQTPPRQQYSQAVSGVSRAAAANNHSAPLLLPAKLAASQSEEKQENVINKVRSPSLTKQQTQEPHRRFRGSLLVPTATTKNANVGPYSQNNKNVAAENANAAALQRRPVGATAPPSFQSTNNTKNVAPKNQNEVALRRHRVTKTAAPPPYQSNSNNVAAVAFHLQRPPMIHEDPRTMDSGGSDTTAPLACC